MNYDPFTQQYQHKGGQIIINKMAKARDGRKGKRPRRSGKRRAEIDDHEQVK
jgi:hypothetical protein